MKLWTLSSHHRLCEELRNETDSVSQWDDWWAVVSATNCGGTSQKLLLTLVLRRCKRPRIKASQSIASRFRCHDMNTSTRPPARHPSQRNFEESFSCLFISAAVALSDRYHLRLNMCVSVCLCEADLRRRNRGFTWGHRGFTTHCSCLVSIKDDWWNLFAFRIGCGSRHWFIFILQPCRHRISSIICYFV